MDAAAAFGASPHLRNPLVAAFSDTTNGPGPGCSMVMQRRSFMAILKLEVPKSCSFGFHSCTKLARAFPVRASDNGEESMSVIAPFQPESPTGQFLTQLLQSHPHLVSAAVEQELERLAEGRETEDSQEQPNPSGTELVLYRRIAELKTQERRKALEEIIYTLIVQKFVEAGIDMVPNLACLSPSGKPWPVQVKELESVHSFEALELIRHHLALVLAGRGAVEYIDENTSAQISKLRVGQVYAASMVYGYFLRRMYNRFHLEKNLKLLPYGLEDWMNKDAAANGNEEDSMSAEFAAVLRGLGWAKQAPNFVKSSKLLSYIMSFDTETLQGFGIVRSKESLRVLEKHAQALYGRPEVRISPNGLMTVPKDEMLIMRFSGLKRLVLEAVAFGSFLWDVESYVDSRYNFVMN